VTGFKIPVLGFAYSTGVRNIRKVISTDNELPMSLTTLLKREKRKPKPSVIKTTGIMKRGKRINSRFGTIS
jgi:hypothetical protein